MSFLFRGCVSSKVGFKRRLVSLTEIVIHVCTDEHMCIGEHLWTGEKTFRHRDKINVPTNPLFLE